MFRRDMTCLESAFVFLTLVLIMPGPPCLGQEVAIKGSDLVPVLSFEAPPSEGRPGGWGGGPLETISLDDTVVHSDHGAVRIERNPSSAGNFSTSLSPCPCLERQVLGRDVPAAEIETMSHP